MIKKTINSLLSNFVHLSDQKFSGASDASDGQTMQDAPSFGDDDWSIYSYSKAN